MKDERDWRLDELREEARYRRERLELYRARIYAGRARNEDRLRDYERALQGASARLHRAEVQRLEEMQGENPGGNPKHRHPPSPR
jgi:hypothetical protein